MSDEKMHRLFITYDLNSPGQNYAGVEKAIKALGEAIKPLETVWFVHTDKSAKEARDAVVAAMDKNDRLVVGVTGAMAWRGIGKSPGDWLKEHG